MSVPKPPFHTAIEELVYEIYQKLSTTSDGLRPQDIDTLAKLNALITDGDLVTTGDLDNMRQSVKGNVPPVADTLEKIYGIIQGLNFITAQDIDTLAELNNILTDANLLKQEDITSAIEAVKGNVPSGGDTLEKLYKLIQGLTNLTAADIDTLAELNAILTDADLVSTSDLANAMSLVEANRWKYLDLGDLFGVSLLDLTGKAIIRFRQTGNILDFNFTGEVVGKHYLFIIERTVNYSFQLKAGRYYLPFGNALYLTDPTTNGTIPAFSRDVISALCLEPGRLVLVPSHNLLPN